MSTAVHWASYIRELFIKDVPRSYSEIKFSTDAEIDESLFGPKIKYNRNNACGQNIKIFAIIEWKSNLLIMYALDKRNSDTKIPLIEKHVERCTHIFSDN